MTDLHPSPEQLALFRRLFCRGQRDYYGTYFTESGRYMVCKEPVTDQVIIRHLMGVAPLGVFPLVGEHVTVGVVDFDAPDRDPVVRLRETARTVGLVPYTERSKGKGFHVWFFWERPVEAKRVALCLRSILALQGGAKVEVFPKQWMLTPGSFGSFVNCPLFGALVPDGRTIFVQDDFAPWTDQWQFLSGVQPSAEHALRRVVSAVAANNDPDPDVHPTRPSYFGARSQELRTRGLLPCKKRMLETGVNQNQRLATFYLAVALRAAGLPESSALAVLLEWRHRNHPQDGRSVITEAEVHGQTRCAFRRPYAGQGCHSESVAPFCSPDCRLHRVGYPSAPRAPGEETVQRSAD